MFDECDDMVTIIDLRDDREVMRQVAELFVDGFRGTTVDVDWPTFDAAFTEVQQSLGEGRISRAALTREGEVIGWIGGIEEYDGRVWELHPLVVRRDYRRRGVGRALVEDFEKQVGLRGGVTIRVGTDDENNRTSLGGADLYPDVLKCLSEIKNLGEHPYEFYQKLGYVITGVIPDANGFGRPDILLAKRVMPAG